MSFDDHWAKERRPGPTERAMTAILNEPARFEYTEARSLEQVNKHAAAGWRVHTALLVPGSAAKLYLMERPRTGASDEAAKQAEPVRGMYA